MAAPTYVGAAWDYSTSGAISITPPAGSDYYLAFTVAWATTQIATPTGWTLLYSAAPSSTTRTAVFSATPGSGPSSTWAAPSGLSSMAAVVVGYAGTGISIDGTASATGAQGSYAANSWTSAEAGPAVTPTNDALLVSAWMGNPYNYGGGNNLATVITPPSGWSNSTVTNNESTGANDHDAVFVAHKAVNAGVSSGIAQWNCTISCSTWNAGMRTIALTASGGGSPNSFPFRRNPSRGLIMRGRR